MKTIPAGSLAAAVILSGVALELPRALRGASPAAVVSSWVRPWLPHAPAKAVSGASWHLADLAKSLAFNLENSSIRETPVPSEVSPDSRIAGVQTTPEASVVTAGSPLFASRPASETEARESIPATAPGCGGDLPASAGSLAMEKDAKRVITVHPTRSGAWIRLRTAPDAEGKSRAPRACVVSHRVIS